jgi:hypothetical protein
MPWIHKGEHEERAASILNFATGEVERFMVLPLHSDQLLVPVIRVTA